MLPKILDSLNREYDFPTSFWIFKKCGTTKTWYKIASLPKEISSGRICAQKLVGLSQIALVFNCFEAG